MSKQTIDVQLGTSDHDVVIAFVKYLLEAGFCVEQELVSGKGANVKATREKTTQYIRNWP